MNSSFKKNIVLINSFFEKEINDEKEALNVSKIINKEASGEYSSYRKELFANKIFIAKIITLAEKYIENDIILRNLISAIGFICSKYSYFNNEAFDYLTKNVNNKKNIVKIAIVKNIYKFPQFKDWDICWDYTLSIPKISPQKESIEYFYRIVDKYLNYIPKKETLKVIDLLMKYINENSISEYRKNDYLVLIEKLSVPGNVPD